LIDFPKHPAQLKFRYQALALTSLYHIASQNATKFLFCCVGKTEYQYSKPGHPIKDDPAIPFLSINFQTIS